MPAAPLLAASIWTAPECAGGTRVAVLPDLLRGSVTYRLTGEDEGTLTLPLDSPAASACVGRRILRLDYADGSVDELRIASVVAQSGESGGTLQVRAVALLFDLRSACLLSTATSGVVSYAYTLTQQTPAQVIDSVLLPALAAAGYGWIARGTIDATLADDWSWSAPQTPLEVMRMLADRTQCELSLRRNGASNYQIHLETQRGASQPVADVRTGKNLVSLRRTLDAHQQQATAIVGQAATNGTGLGTIAHACWRVTAKDATNRYLDLADPDGGDGPIQEDDQANTWHAAPVDGSTPQQVTDSWRLSATSSRVQLVSGANMAKWTVGDLIEFRADASGTELVELTSPSALATYGRKVGLYDRTSVRHDSRNLLVNPWFRTWTTPTSPPDGWSDPYLHAIARDATVTRRGGYSAKWATFPAASATDTGLQSPTVYPRAVVGAATFSARAAVYVATAGTVGSATLSLALYNATSGTLITQTTATYTASTMGDRWTDLTLDGVDLTAYNVAGVALRVTLTTPGDSVSHATWYLDATLLSRGTSAAPHSEYGEATALWQDVNARLVEVAAPVPTYDVTLRDLTRLDASADTGWPYDALALGATLRVTDDDLGITTSLRIVELTANLLDNLDTQLTLSTIPPRLSRRLAA